MSKQQLNEQGFKLDDNGKLSLGLSATSDFITIFPTLAAGTVAQ